MTIRQATPRDLNQILAIYASARAYMKAKGNATQWGDDHPPVDLIEEDIDHGVAYVIEDDQDRVHGVFALIMGDDPTYEIIDQGQWLNEDPYGTIHRLASDGHVKGIGRLCFDYSKTLISNLRCDTHGDNKGMQDLLLNNDFIECGIIYAYDGSPRIAYQYVGD